MSTLFEIGQIVQFNNQPYEVLRLNDRGLELRHTRTKRLVMLSKASLATQKPESRISTSTIGSLMALRGFNSKSQLARELGITTQTLLAWRIGRSKPNPTQLKKLAEVLDTTVERLVVQDLPDRTHKGSQDAEQAKAGSQTPSEANERSESLQAPDSDTQPETAKEETTLEWLARIIPEKAAFSEEVVSRLLAGRKVSPELMAELLLEGRVAYLLSKTPDEALIWLSERYSEKIQADIQAQAQANQEAETEEPEEAEDEPEDEAETQGETEIVPDAESEALKTETPTETVSEQPETETVSEENEAQQTAEDHTETDEIVPSEALVSEPEAVPSETGEAAN